MRGVTYTVTVTISHDDSGDIDTTVHVFDVGDSEQDRRSIAYALREAAKQVEEGLPVEVGKFN
jgi:hypothetical protein